MQGVMAGQFRADADARTSWRAREALVQLRRDGAAAGDGEAAEGRGRLPPAWFPSEACATARGGPRKKSRKYQRSRLQQNIWSARRSEPRDLWPNAQPAPRLHRRTSFCLREQAVSTLYVPKLGSALCSTPAASWLPRSRTRPSRQRRCICSTY